MAYKILTGAYAAGYAVKANYVGVQVAASASVGGTGLTASTYMVVTNDGTLTNTDPGTSDAGLYLSAGGSFRNQGLVTALSGVDLQGASRVTNLGTILASFYGLTDQTAACIVDNYGLILSGNGINIAGGDVTNLGTIYGRVETGSAGDIVTNGSKTDTTALMAKGFDGVAVYGGSVINFGHIASLEKYSSDYGVSCVGADGRVVNGAATDRTASIQGYTGLKLTSGTLVNYGAITGLVGYGVSLTGGMVTNGVGGDTSAEISGATGIAGASGSATVVNLGTVIGNGLVGSAGVSLGAGGAITNGALTDTAARIVGYVGVMAGKFLTLANFGTIQGQGSFGSPAVSLAAGGAVVNGAFSDTVALIDGVTGVSLGAIGSVSNYGSIDGEDGEGVVMSAGGVLKNGSATDRAALIEGYIGVDFDGAGGIANFGVIRNLANSFEGVSVSLGAVTNGSLADTTALIEGYNGLYASRGAVTNFGTILAEGAPAADGVILTAGAALNNRAGALIEGYAGVTVTGAGTVTNGGTIRGLGGTAIAFGSASDKLVALAGSSFVGKVLGAGGTLVVSGGVGVFTGLFGAVGVTVSGDMAATTFKAFNTVEVGAGTTFSASGSITLAASQKLIDDGRLTVSGSIVDAGLIESDAAGAAAVIGAVDNTGKLVAAAGTLTVAGAVTGAGSGQVDAGLLDFTAASSFDEDVAFVGTGGTLELAHSRTYAGTISGFSLTGGAWLDLADVGFVAGTTKASFAGTAAGGVLTVTDGSEVARIHLAGDYTASAWTLGGDGHGGTLVVDPSKGARAVGENPPGNAASPPHAFIQAAAGFGARSSACGAPTPGLAMSPAQSLARPAASAA